MFYLQKCSLRDTGQYPKTTGHVEYTSSLHTKILGQKRRVNVATQFEIADQQAEYLERKAIIIQ